MAVLLVELQVFILKENFLLPAVGCYLLGHRERRGFSGADMVTGQSKHKSSHLDVKPVTGKSAGLKSLEAHREEMKNFKEEEEKVRNNFQNFRSVSKS